jgi:hypothetical protein
MHPRHTFLLLLLLGGISLAQDTNFSAGPQYLVTTSSPTLLRPITTPSLTLGEIQPLANSSTTAEAALAHEAPAPAAITNQTFLSNVYWGDHSLGEIEAHRVTTPSLSLGENTTSTSTTPGTESTTSASLPGLPGPSAGNSSVIEISSGALPANLPASMFEIGVTGSTTAQSLRERGYGTPLGDVAAYWKVNKPSAVRVFTNRDVQRLHGT